MKAVELKEKFFMPQYDNIIAKLEAEASNGCFVVDFTSINSNVIDRLLSEGFDVEVSIDENGKEANYAVSCVNAQEGRKGCRTQKVIQVKEASAQINKNAGGIEKKDCGLGLGYSEEDLKYDGWFE